MAEAQEEKKDAEAEREPMPLEGFGLNKYKCNAPPVNPYEDWQHTPAQQLLAELFDTGGWRIDCGRPRTSVHHAKIIASLERDGPASEYVTAVCEDTGVTALHAAAINGYEELFKALVEKGSMDFTSPAAAFNRLVSSRFEVVKGPDCMWMAKRRGHKKLLKFMMVQPGSKNLMEELNQTLEKEKMIRKKHIANYKRKLEEEIQRKKEEEERLRKEEEERRKKEQKQREFRETIRVYNGELKGMHEEILAGDWQLWETGRDKSLDLLKRARSNAEKEMRRIEKYQNLAVLHEVERDMKRPKECLDNIIKQIEDYTTMWDFSEEFDTFAKDSAAVYWTDLDPAGFEEESRGFMTKTKKLPKTVKKSAAYKGLDTAVKDLATATPLVGALHNDSMRKRHWLELAQETGADVPFPFEPAEGEQCKFGPGLKLNDNLQVGQIMTLELHKGAVGLIVEEITDKASKEAKQETQLETLQETWSKIDLAMSLYKETDVPILKMMEEDFELLEADLLTLQGMVASRYDYWKAQSTQWQRELNTLADTIQMLAELQRMWSYLEPLFVGSDEVRKELPSTAEQFLEIDGKVRTYLKQMWSVKNAKAAANIEGLLPEIEQLQAGQELCKKALVDFMDGKRRKFARFYFVSEADLLDILSNGSQPKTILRHIDKVLLSTKQLKLDESQGERPWAARFIAGVGAETAAFEPEIPLEGKVEVYLEEVLRGQKGTLRRHLKRCFDRYPTIAREEWVKYVAPGAKEPADAAQIILLVAAMYYVSEVEAAFAQLNAGDADALKNQLTLVADQLKELVKLTRTPLTKGERKRIMCMITLDAHSRDIVSKLILQGADKATHFGWQSQLKQRYVDETIDAQIDILNASFFYDFEYLGNGARLVVTPLTDRIYVTATQALHLSMGCAPAGPAGTGKTESTKDLASALGICCYVINCSPEMDYVSMGNIFKGLAASGSWGCFDEFNRLIPEVLSVCSVQFKAVCVGVKGYVLDDPSTHTVTVDGDTVSLIPKCGAFITMNPGYLGRSELPEGLKALFRPMTVMVPDLVLICENFLMAEGFVNAKVLASKFYGLYSLLKDLLSKQDHYDWGLRAVKSVLVVAGQLLRASPDIEEAAVLMRALRDFNIPKIVQVDEVIFFGLLSDLFPGLHPERVFDENLQQCVVQACGNIGYHAHEIAVLKAVQLQELLDIRHCVFVMGPPGSAKSACWKTLQEARNIDAPDFKVKIVDLNPKVLPTQDLYGYINMSTREWKDGLLSNVMRALGQIPDENPKWILLDGDLDANWIESMNSVMDDNRMLTLASNERIPLKPYMRMIFEIRDLKYATPATVSRAGILYISTEEGFQWRSIIASWVAQRDPEAGFNDVIKEQLTELFEKYVPETLRFFRKSMVPIVKCEDTNMTMNLLRLLEAQLTKAMLTAADAAEKLEPTFVFCAVWAFGSALGLGDDGTDYKKNFSEWWKRAYKTVAFPPRDTVFDFYLQADGSFDSWEKSSAFSAVEFDSRQTTMSEVTVPTGETASVAFWMRHLVDSNYPVMLCGLSGTGKTQLVNGLLRSLNPDDMVSQVISMNFYTSGVALQAVLETSLQKQTASTFGPPAGKKMVYFIDDLNLPMVDPYNTQSAIALVRQHLDYTHWYDPVKLSLKTIVSCQYVTAMNPTAGSFLINPRLQRWFTTFAVSMPNTSSLTTIYDTFLEGHFSNNGFAAEICSLKPTLIKSTLAVHKDVAETFRKTAANFHYEFNIRHLSGVFEGLLMAKSTRFNTAEKMAFMWCHECERIYGDRLVSYDDLSKFYGIMLTQSKKAFPSFDTAQFYGDDAASGDSDPLVFCHFGDGIGEDPVYDRIEMKTLSTTLDAALEDYNEMNVQMDLVLFNDAMRHICKITRIINNPAGHALLVGVGGSGKQSLSRLSSHICGYATMTITISATYGINDLKTDLQAMYRKAGIAQQGVTFLFTDNQITNEKFLVYLNDLLNSGNIADLYAADEKDTVCNDVINKAKAANVPLEPPSLYAYFISQVRRNLHVILCCSPVGEAFRTRCLKFPALVNCTVIDWFQPWPEEALFSVGRKAISEIELDSDETRAGIEKFLPASFKQVELLQKEFLRQEGRSVYTTPKSYLELLKLYKLLLDNTRRDNDRAQYRLKNGIEKLNECASVVDVLKADLAVMLKSAEKKAAVAEGIAKVVRADKEVVEMETENANIEAEKVMQIQIDVTQQQASAEADLAKAEPAVEAAMAALDTLDVKALGMCKTMMKPPGGVDDVFSAVIVLMGGVKELSIGAGIPTERNGKVRDKNRDWGSAKKYLLGDVKQFVAELKLYKDCFDRGQVNHLNFKEVRMYLAMEHFNVATIEGKNSAAAGLCNWVINIVIYYDVVVTVEPKRKALAEANVTLSEANTRLEDVRAKVAQLDAKLAKLKAEFEEANATKMEAEATVARGKMKLDLAQRLINALSSENVRWGKGIEQLAASRTCLIGDALLSASFISYIGPFTKEFRDRLVDDSWIPLIRELAIPMADPAGPLNVLTNDSEIAKWNTQGLQSDKVSVENGAIVCRSSRWPLMIDPQLQGIAWIKSMEGGDPDRLLQVVRLTNSDLMFKMTRALENGFPVLIENIGEKIDATLMPVIQRATSKRGSKYFLQLGDDEVELHKDFQLYMHTKLSNPHYPPEIQAECTLINFTVTPSGLEDQLLSLVVRKERPDLAAKKAALIQQQNECMIRIGELEDEILHRLAAAEGDITEDRDLIEGLENAKRLSIEINKQLDQGKKTSKQINMTSEKYRPTARRGSQLFFLMNRLVMVHTYYIYSLNAFVVVFSSAIDQVQLADKAAAKKKLGGPRLKGLKRLQSFTKTIIHSMQRFQWNHNLLLDASHTPKRDPAALNEFITGGSGGATGDEVFEVGDRVDTSFGVGTVLEKIQSGGKAGYKVELGGSTLNGRPMVFRLGTESVRKFINYAERTTRLSDKITNTVFNYVRRGLFERDKLLVTTLMFFTLQVADQRLSPEIVNTMLQNKLVADPPALPDELAEWLPEPVFHRVLQVVKDLSAEAEPLSAVPDELAALRGEWEAWYTHSKPETLPVPGAAGKLGKQHRLPLLRAMRPDRVTFALEEYIRETEGSDYVFQPPFDMAKTYQESSASTPIFFVLFPGVDPTGWVEDLGKTFNITLARGMFVNISMGQGQEKPAEAMLEKMSQTGGWVMLQNLHLMQNWLPHLERKLEVCSMHAHQDFRCFISAEPPSFSYFQNIPESLLQSCIKVANEAPSDLKSNISRAWAAFDENRLSCVPEQLNPFKACLFGLCFFHSVMLGRKKYGQQGWSRGYSFNTGDLTICGDVLESYLRGKDIIPWDDLRYVFGEIMYGGHITDFWDRRTNNTYLELLMTPGLLSGNELGPGFPSPDPEGLWYSGYIDYVGSTLPPESPPMYGLHENSEIAYLNSSTENIFGTILRLRAGSSSGGGGDSGGGIDALIVELLERMPGQFDMITMGEKAQPLMSEAHQPYVLVSVQECGRMNLLLKEIAVTLDELQKGRAGQLNMTQKMEDCGTALSLNQVPGRNPFHKCSWEKLAWPSMKGLSSWYADMIERCAALDRWTDKLILPHSLWLSALFNPTSFLTAIKQVTARAKQLPLDNMTTETHVTRLLTSEEAVNYPGDGAFVHGIFIEGARWQDLDESAGSEEDIDGTTCAGILTDSRPRELLVPMPLVYVKAVIVQPDWDPQSVGYIRPEADLYNCPVYSTTFRGPTYVFVATLKTESQPSKWVSAGVALVFQEND